MNIDCSFLRLSGNTSNKAGQDYTYNAQVSCSAGNRTIPHAASSYAGNSYGYNCNGNMTRRDPSGAAVYNFQYDAESRMVAVSGSATASFVFDGDGNRVKSTAGGVTRVHIGAYFEWTGSTSTMKKYYYAGGVRVAMRTGASTLSFILSDHLGSTSVTTNSSGALLTDNRYKAWGESRYASGTLPTKFTYTGQYSNVADFGLMYYGARWYDSALSRFAQADTDVPESQGVQAFDRYAYANNNPLRYSDPSGHSIWDTIGQFATGFVYEFARTNPWYSPHAQDVLRVNSTESDAMLAGRVVADVATIAVGVVEVAGGIAIGTAGTAVACGTTLCLGAAATVVGGAVVTAAGVTTAVAGAAGLGGNLALISGRPQGFVDSNSLTDHFLRHGSEFGFSNESEYLAGAQGFIATEGNRGVLSKVRANGDKILYNPTTNEFAVVSKDGTIRTYFKPDPSVHGYKTNLDYFKAQK